MKLRALILLLIGGGVLAAAPASPWHRTPGALTLAAYEPLRPVVTRWAAAFQAAHPDERIRLRFVGSDVAMAHLSSGTCDVAILGREATAFEAKAFEWVFQRPPGQVDVLTGSCDHPGSSAAIAVFVRTEDPRRIISFAELRRLLGDGGADSGTATPSPAPSGGQTVFMPNTESGTGRFIRRAVLHDSRSLRWDVIREFPEHEDNAVVAGDPSASILAALLRSRAGLAIAGNVGAVPAGLRRLALAGEDNRPVELNAETVAARKYPLVRTVRAYFHRPANEAVDRITHDFLAYVVSADGQAMVTPADGYLALPAAVAEVQRAAIAALPSARTAAGLDSVEEGRAVAEQVVAQYPSYVPRQHVSGVIRVWGHGHVTLRWLDRLTHAWAAGFRRFHPDARFDFQLHGTSSAVPALYSGDADIALLGEELLPAESAAFAKVKHYAPTSFAVMTGSVDVRNFDFAQMFFVHRDNPRTEISLPELAAIFGAEERRGDRPIHTWGDMGLTGEWADKPITPYGWRTDDSFGFYLQNAMLGGDDRWNPRLREFAHVYRADGSIHDHGEQILEALAQDRFGIAVSNIRYAGPDVKPLALAARPGEEAFAATTANLISRRYPLSRLLPAIVDQPPGQPLDPKVREFLRFVLSREGQAAIVDNGRYLPLAPETAARERAALEAPDQANAAIRIAGDTAMANVVARWQAGFEQTHPGMHVVASLVGTATAMPALYLGHADLALLGREADTTDQDGFLHTLQYRPTQFELLNGSIGTPKKSAALAVYVAAENPVRRLSLRELDAICSAERRRGGAPIRTWGDLGATGPWQEAPIRVYLCDIDTGTGAFFVHRVLRDCRKLNWDRVTEPGASGEQGRDETGAATMAALKRDRFGLAISTTAYADPTVAPVALSEAASDAGVLPTQETIVSGAYPLARVTTAFVNRRPGRPLDPAVRAFLKYVLSSRGQADIAAAGDFLPLSPAAVARERTKLDAL